MELKQWLTETNTSIKGFARTVKVERAMIYRYFLGTIPRARTIRKIEIITGGAVTAQDFYASALQQMSLPSQAQAADMRHLPFIPMHTETSALAA